MIILVVNPDAEKREELKTLESIKKAIDFREMVRPISYRQNTLVNTFAIPELMFKASAISISKDLVKEADSIFYHFIWNGEAENGGLNKPDTESMIRTKRVTCWQKF